MDRPRRAPPLLLFVLIALSLAASDAAAQVDGYPYLDNETLGLVRSMAAAVEGPAEQFDEDYWALQLIESIDGGGDVMSPFRYLVAFSAYSVAQAAVYTPAWREPYHQAFDRYVDKMAQPIAWEDFLTEWGGESPFGPDNIMYTGHLAYMMTLQRRLFGDDRFDSPFVLTGTDGSTWQTDVHVLTASLSAQADTNVDSADANHFNVPCEPGHVFVPCNTPHRLSEHLYDRAHGTDYGAGHGQWLGWVRAEMVDEATGVLFDLYWPYGRHQLQPGELPPEREDRLSGIYNAWTIWFLLALDADWARELYPAFVDQFVVRGADSPFPDGRTTVVDTPGDDGLLSAPMNQIATAFGMATARAMGDEELAEELEASWRAAFGEPQWSADGTTYSFAGPLYPFVFQNGFPLLARTSTAEHNIGVDTLSTLPADRFEQPFVARVGEATAFVNQAIWDADERQLVVTVNGGSATTASVEIEVANLDPEVTWEVWRDGELYADQGHVDDRLVITTPPLSPTLESYIVRAAAEPDPVDDDDTSGDDDALPEGDDAGDDSGACGCGAGRGGGPVATVLGLGLLIGALAPVCRTIRRRCRVS